MGSIDVFVGQCGCQLGQHIYQDTNHSIILKQTNRFTYKVNSVFIDTEPKVISHLKTQQHKMIHNQNIIFRQSGRANCWPYGYYDQNKVKDQQRKTNNRNDFLNENTELIEEILQKVRKNVEQTDLCQILYLFNSLAGGTGSGLGSRLLEEFKSQFYDLNIANFIVFPFDSGENALQNYNILLSLNQQIKYSDYILYFENEKVAKILQEQSNKSISNKEINQFIIENYLNLLKIDQKNKSHFSVDILNNLVSQNNNLKFIQMTSQQLLKKNNIDPIIKDIQRIVNLHKQQQYNDNKQKLYGSFIQLEESNYSETTLDNQELEYQINSVINKNYEVLPDMISHQIETPINNKPQTNYVPSNFIMTCSNDTSHLIEKVKNNCLIKFHSRAYLHYFYEAGLEQMDFLECFDNLENLLFMYKDN